MAGGAASRDQALSLLAAANNHGDLAVKLSSLRQAKGILLSIDPASAADLFPFLVELQYSPETLVRRSLIELVDEMGLKAMESTCLLMPILLTFLRDEDAAVATQSVRSISNLFCSVLEEMVLQVRRRGKVERWLEELWSWMNRFKDAVFALALEPGRASTRILALKFLETYVLLFTSNSSETETVVAEGGRQKFNISWLVGGHPVLEPYFLMSEANRTLGILLNLLQTANNLPGSLIISVVNCLAGIARKRPLHYGTILTTLLDFKPNPEMLQGSHAPSVIYSLRTAFLGFLRCTNPTILESRDQLIRALRAMNAGDAADQAVRHADKMIKNAERALRDARYLKDDQSSHLPVSGDTLKKRSALLDNEDSAAKRLRYGVESNGPVRDSAHSNGVTLDLPPMNDGELNPVEKMIAVIAALLAEGERGVESLDILVSKIHPDLLADIVITNMKHLPKMTFPTRLGNLPTPRLMNPLNGLSQAIPESPPRNSVQSPTLQSTLVTEMPSANNLPNDSKRDPRRDPRRLDPRRVSVPAVVAANTTVDGANVTQFDYNGSIVLTNPHSFPVDTKIEHSLGPLNSRDEEMESQSVHRLSQSTPKNEVIEEIEDLKPVKQADTSLDPTDSPDHKINESASAEYQDFPLKDEVDESPFFEFDDHCRTVSDEPELIEVCKDLPKLPLFVELSQEQQERVRKLAINRIIDSYKHSDGTECSQMRLELLARMVAQIDADDEVCVMLQKHVIVDYQEMKGHELVLHVLYHLYSLNTSIPSNVYEKFLLTVVTALLESLPASDKSFSKLLGDVPMLPASALKLLSDLCSSDVTDGHGKDIRDVERVTQGLGAVWSLILGRPVYRQACLDIALRCAVHSHDEIRAKAIRLVANKLYQLTYISENIEQFATQMLMSAVDNEQNVGSVETSVSDSQVSDSGNSENDSTTKGRSAVSLLEAQRLISLYFALCTKKPDLLRLVFRIYGGAPKTAKQAFHRHIPILIRALGSSYSELLNIISDPPEGSENLLTLVLQILTQETTPSPDLIATVKHLYETKLKDVSILIPMLSSLSKTEVLPIFPRLIALPLEKFQMALAHILQGSAHTGPALTPAEVLVAIHGIVPEKDSLPLKKITDACSACFEQRTVFTQQVLAKALTKMVDQTPLPLLFMRTVIQCIDAFPALVDFVMEILSKLVSKQVWKMPKLWVGFLKCVSQTQPHSFEVLLKLPPQPLESALNKHPSLRTPLATFASQPSIRSSLSGQTLAVLGLANETHNQLPHGSSSDASSSVRGAALT